MNYHTKPKCFEVKNLVLFSASPYEMQIIINAIYILKLILLLPLNSAAKPENVNSE